MTQNNEKLTPAAFGKVAVLLGGRSSEREVSLMSGQGVLNALRAQGVDAHAFDPAEKDLCALKTEGFARCFIALHGRHGEDGTVQGALELLGIPYTGSGVMASSMAMDKIMTKRIWRFEGLPTPDWRMVASVADTQAAFAALGIIGIVGLIAYSPNRLNRVLAAYQECSGTDAQKVCYQSIHAKYALAEGGLFGVGLGNSREKWNYLPEAHNDFIFAIIGGETGFIGAAIVIILFVVLGGCMISVALQTADRYASVSLLCITVWLVGQALINIGVVVGVFPVMGVPMPFVSAGGSSLIMCLAAAGVAASLMRAQPQIKADSSRA